MLHLDLWTDALGLFKNKPHEDLSKSKGQCIAIDVSILINKCNGRELTQLCTTNVPVYPSPEILEERVKPHVKNFVEAGIRPVLVFDGNAPEVKKIEKHRRQQVRESYGQEYQTLLSNFCQQSKEEEGIMTTISDEEYEKAIESRKKTAHPTEYDHAAVIAWATEENIAMVGALFEADQQLVKLEKDGVVDGIATEDGDLVVLGGKKVYTKMSTKDGHASFRVFDRDEFMNNLNLYHSKLALYPHLIPDVALLLGNDYLQRIPGHGKVTVLEDKDWKLNRKDKRRIMD